MKTSHDWKTLTLRRAAALFLRHKRIINAAGTVECYRDYLLRVLAFFRRIPGTLGQPITLNEIHIGHFQEYQRRKRCPAQPCADCHSALYHYHPASTNHDLNTLSQILRRADLWRPIAEHYEPLPVPKWQPPKVLSEREEEAFFKLAASSSEWSLAYQVASLTNNTSASGIELRSLRLEHVDLESTPPIIQIPEGKNQYRVRGIPLNERGEIQVRRILQRARSLGSTKPGHFLFPFRLKRGLYDPTHPATESWLKHQWKKLVDSALEQRIISFPITPHNLRHQIITKLLENGQPEEVVRGIAGHVDRRMMEHYSHARIERKYQALDSINPGKRQASAATPAKARSRNAGA